LLEVLPIMRHHVEHEQPATRLEHAGSLSDHNSRIRHVVENEEQQRDIDFPVSERQSLETAVPDVDIVHALQPLPGGGQHRVRLVHRDHFLDERGERLRDGTRAAPQIGNLPAPVEQSEQRDISTTTEQLDPHPVPMASRRGEEFLRFRVTGGEHRLRTARIVFRGAGVDDLVPHEMPEAARRAVHIVGGNAVVSTRPLGASLDPAFGTQDLQMPADRRLRQLENRLQLIHRQLVSLQGEEDSAPRRVCEGGHLTKQQSRGQGINPFIRI
jgi:hypothetical protein